MPKPPKYSEFGEVVETLIKEYNRSKVSEFVMMDFESKLIDYVVDSDYGIYVRVPCGKWSEYFEVSDEDLPRFIKDSRVVVKIEKLSLYTEATEALSDIYYEVREPDEYGNYPKCPEIPKEFPISSELFRIKGEDLTDLLEDIKADGLFDLKVKEGEEVTEGNNSDIETTNPTKLKLVRHKEEVYWKGILLPTINGKSFDILLELSKIPNEPVRNAALYEFIESSDNEDKLLNQRISKIRNTFPPPYNDIKHSECIIPDAKRNKGYRSLNLAKEQIEIV